MDCFIQNIPFRCFCLYNKVMDIFLEAAILIVNADRKFLGFCMTIFVSYNSFNDLAILITDFKLNSCNRLLSCFICFFDDNLTDCILILHYYLLDFFCLCHFKFHIVCNLVAIRCCLFSKDILSCRKSLDKV